MERITAPSGVTVSYDTYGSGPPLVLVHGAFSNHDTNWEFVKPLFEKQFTLLQIFDLLFEIIPRAWQLRRQVR